jgi:Tfp pilus assembly protein PilV
MFRLSKRDDRGESLVELLVALGIMATAVIALLGALATAIRISEVHRYQAEAGAFTREFAERLENTVASSATGYKECLAGQGNQALVGIYEGYWDIPPSRASLYERQVLKVTYWNTTAFMDICPATNDIGVQRVTLRVRSKDPDRPTVSETLEVTLRKPCRPGTTPCA